MLYRYANKQLVIVRIAPYTKCYQTKQVLFQVVAEETFLIFI